MIRAPSSDPSSMKVRLLIASLLLIGVSAFAKPRKPNVLFLAVDDMNDWIG